MVEMIYVCRLLNGTTLAAFPTLAIATKSWKESYHRHSEKDELTFMEIFIDGKKSTDVWLRNDRIGVIEHVRLYEGVEHL